MSNFKLALQTLISIVPKIECISLKFNQINMSLQTKFKVIKTNKQNVGLKALANRFQNLNGKITLD
jgi:hypothetical protein